MEIVNKVAEFLDHNIRIVRYTVSVVAVTGVVVILRKTYAFSVFNSIHEIPKNIIERNSTLRGTAQEIVDDRLINLQHLPIFYRDMESRKRYFGQKSAPFKVAIAGIKPCSGCLEHLQSNIQDRYLKVIPLGISENALESIVYLKKGSFRRSICINEDLVLRGLAIVQHDTELSTSNAYLKLSQRLLAAEMRADRKGKGVWKRPSYVQRLKIWWSLVEMPSYFERLKNWNGPFFKSLPFRRKP
eukprot:Seg1019.2 transcript_id=Seg1019.2/GoldUCD/mRNA.D3Y31 product="Protein C3orf33" protein_id=Seg1019.2/GoldUCD/D3Y31